jgi:hypothetical protein
MRMAVSLGPKVKAQVLDLVPLFAGRAQALVPDLPLHRGSDFAKILISDTRLPVAGWVEMTRSPRPNFSKFA